MHVEIVPESARFTFTKQYTAYEAYCSIKMNEIIWKIVVFLFTFNFGHQLRKKTQSRKEFEYYFDTDSEKRPQQTESSVIVSIRFDRNSLVCQIGSCCLFVFTGQFSSLIKMETLFLRLTRKLTHCKNNK